LTQLKSPTNELVGDLIKKFQPLVLPPFSLEPHLKLINHCFSADTYEGVLENLSADGSEFAKAQLKELEKMVFF
jgi:hypothetical protein